MTDTRLEFGLMQRRKMMHDVEGREKSKDKFMTIATSSIHMTSREK